MSGRTAGAGSAEFLYPARVPEISQTMHSFRIIPKFVRRRLFLLVVAGLLVFGQACAGPSIFTRSAQTPRSKLSIAARQESVEEGQSIKVRIKRDLTEGDLSVILALGGDAVLERDYTVGGADKVEANTVTVTIPNGQKFAELLLDVVDDVSAEAAETVTLSLQAVDAYAIDKSASSVTVRIPRNDFAITTTNDSGEGSLRQAILNANVRNGADTIRFDSIVGPFATPRIIVLESELPDLVDELVIDGYIEDRLWKASGVTVSGDKKYRVFNVEPGAKVTIKHVTIADGRAGDGGGIANRGDLVVKSSTFTGNAATNDGGGLASLGGFVTIINSTLANNTAGEGGGGLADIGGTATVTNCTFTENTAKSGGGLFSTGILLLRNTILANSFDSADCVAAGAFVPTSTNNLIEVNDGCGEPISTADPRLGKLGGYNGPTRTIPLGGGSPAINLGDNASAVDETGRPLRWDQRGNGDPRYVAGITDIGAFERQASLVLTVDTFEDTILRACTRAGSKDCSLRGAITLANARRKADVITFDPKVFAVPRTIVLTGPLPELTTDMTIDAGNTAGLTVKGSGQFKVFDIAPDVNVELINIK
jgi:CSLREA domain-containing protein